jgi:Chitobiase/beta-hexosaminidase C-terminal domain/Bacterial Ig-like domain
MNRFWRTRSRTAIVTVTALVSVLLPLAGSAFAATGTRYGSGITSPGGQVWMGTHLWVSDHDKGFCRMDDGDSDGIFLPNQATCNTTMASPGQPAYDPTPANPLTDFVYVPDNDPHSGQGVYRLTFSTSTQTITGAVLLGGTSGGGLAGFETNAVALGPDGNLYVGTLGSVNVYRITNPAGSSQTVETIGQAADAISGVAFAGADLYIAEQGAVKKIPAAPTCQESLPCVAEQTPVTAAGPTALTSDGLDVLYVADGRDVLRYTVSTNTQDIYASKGAVPGGTTPFRFVSALSLKTNGDLLVGDDPSDGEQLEKGREWLIPAGSSPEVAGSPGQPAERPLAPARTAGNIYASPVTGAGGQVWMGDHLWVADHIEGFCRLDDPDPADADPSREINTATCDTSAVSPGQPTYDQATQSIYIPDNSSQSQGIWRLKFDPVSETVGSPLLLASGTGLAGLRTTTTALDVGPDGDLYVGSIKSDTIKRVTNPQGSLSNMTVSIVARSSDGLGVFGMAFIGRDLYTQETGAVTKVARIVDCTSSAPCIARSTPITADAPTALASDGVDVLWIANSPDVLRYQAGSGTEEIYANQGIFRNGSKTRFRFISALTLSPAEDIYVADDPTNGGEPPEGRVWRLDDVVPPSPPTLTGVTPASGSNDNSPSIRGTAEKLSTIRLYDNGSCDGDPVALGPAADFASPGLSAAIADNSSTTFHATARDRSGNTSPCSNDSITYVEDSAAPAVPSTPDLDAASDTGGSSTDDLTKDATPTFSGAAEEGSTVKIFVDGALRGSDVATGGSYSVTTTALSDGAQSVTVSATDRAGNESARSGANGVTIDTAPPTVTANPSGGRYSSSQSVTLSASETANIFYTTDGSTPTQSSTAYSGAITISTDTTLSFIGVDRAGNQSATRSESYTFGSGDTLAPVVQAPSENIVGGAQLGTTNIPVRISWSASDGSGSGLKSYELQQSVNGGTFTTVSLPTLLTKVKSFQLAPGSTYQYRVRATDKAGNTSAYVAGPTFRVTVAQESSAAIVDTGTWTTASLTGAYGGKVQHASVSGAKATLTFSGRDVAWVAQKSANRGRADVFLDGVKVATVDLYSSTTQARRVVFQADGLSPAGSHTLQVAVLGTRNASSSSARVDVDAFVVLQ